MNVPVACRHAALTVAAFLVVALALFIAYRLGPVASVDTAEYACYGNGKMWSAHKTSTGVYCYDKDEPGR